MSDTASFIGGAALAGLAAVILLKGGAATTAPSPTPTLPPYAAVSPAPLPPSSPGTPSASDFDKQRQETERLRLMLEQQRVQTEQLKSQLQGQNNLIQALNAQAKNSWVQQQLQQQQQQQKAQQQQQLQAIPSPSPSPANADHSLPMSSGMMWALGGVGVTFGGGLLLMGIMSLFSRQQRPSSRTIEVIHDNYPNYHPSQQMGYQNFPPARRRPEAFAPPPPSRRTVRRVNAEEFEP